jgi:hypothetical protein
MAAPAQWKSLNLQQRCDEVRKYLGRDVKAVQLPEKVSQDPTYPWLIIDGSSASGVGKIQQAFALLKSTDEPLRLVYQLLSRQPWDGNDQEIYREMRVWNRRLSGAPDFLALVDEAIEYAKERANSTRSDPFSVGFLSTEAEFAFQQDDSGLCRLMVHFARCMLRRKPCSDSPTH